MSTENRSYSSKPEVELNKAKAILDAYYAKAGVSDLDRIKMNRAQRNPLQREATILTAQS